MSKITIEPMTRIESHGRLTIETGDDGSPKKAFFSTPILRGFEAFLRGSPVERVPWLASRICGVCPVSHAVTSSKTIEKALSIQIPETAENLRELLVLSQLVDSHALSFVILSLPDLLPNTEAHSVLDVKSAAPDLFEKGMQLHSLGRKMTSTIGGRNVHPANVRIGGMGMNPLLDTSFDFHSAIDESLDIAQVFLSKLKELLDEQSDLVTSLGSIPSYYMGLSDNGKVSFVRGDVKCVAPDGSEYAKFDPNQYLDHLEETIEPHTYMKLPIMKNAGVAQGHLRVNCLARANVNGSYGTSLADAELAELTSKYGNPLEHSLLSHWARLIEVVYACERVKVLLDDPSMNNQDTAVDATMVDGEDVACLEAPRGTLFHHYKIRNGMVDKANLIVATQNNGLAVNRALTRTLEVGIELKRSNDEIIHHCEMVVRAYDPCISCSTHIAEVEEEF
ncbi:MAG: Ni/Fe hydrogenase subunit alpha [Candidatus Thorarchaeota archaeon]